MNARKYNWIGILSIIMMGFMASCEEPTTTAFGTSAKLLFNENLEGPSPFVSAYTKEVGDWDYALQYVSFPVYEGSRSARFEIRDDQPLVANGKRSEIVVVKGSVGQVTKNTWYSFAVYFPSDSYAIDHTHDVISQWYKDGSPVRLLTIDDRIIMDIGNEKGNKEEFDMGNVPKDVWNEFVFHFIHSHENDGLIEVWHNGIRKIARNGGNMYNDILPKWKIGIYKASYELGTADTKKRIIYFDNIKVGNQNSSYYTMVPSDSVQLTKANGRSPVSPIIQRAPN